MEGLHMDGVQVKAVVPRALKCQVFSVLALREQTFRHWLSQQMQAWLEEMEESNKYVAIDEDDSE
jgi:hypothetical protein